MAFVVLKQFFNFLVIRAVTGNDFNRGVFIDAFDEAFRRMILKRRRTVPEFIIRSIRN